MQLTRQGLGHALGLLALLVADARAGVADTPQPDLARRLGVSERTVRRHELALVEARIVDVRHRGRGNRRELVLVGLDLVPGSGSFPRSSASYPQPRGECGHERPVTGVRTPNAACKGSRAQRTPSERSSDTGPSLFGPIGTWRPGPGSTPPPWAGPSDALDELAEDLHRALGMWPNTLREVVLLARDVAHAEGLERATGYLAALRRHCARAKGERRGALALGALRKRTARGAPHKAADARTLWLAELYGSAEVRP